MLATEVEMAQCSTLELSSALLNGLDTAGAAGGVAHLVSTDLGMPLGIDLPTPRPNVRSYSRSAFTFDELDFLPQPGCSPDTQQVPSLEAAGSAQGEVEGAEQIVAGVQSTAGYLGLPSDPRSWSAAHVHTWLLHVHGLYSLPVCTLPVMSGAQLCELDAEQLRCLTPAGDVLHAQLRIWLYAGQYQDVVRRDAMCTPHYIKDEPSDVNPRPSPVSALLDPDWSVQSRERDDSFSSVSSGYSSCSYASSENEPLPSVLHLLEPRHTARGSPTSPRNDVTTSPVPRPHSEPLAPEAEASEVLTSDVTGINIPTPMFTTPVSTLVASLPGSMDVSCDDKSGVLGGFTPKRRAASERDPMVCDLDRPIHLWEFLLDLLEHPTLYSSYIRWLDRGAGVFKIEDSAQVARLWGKRKNRPAMNYDKLSRSVRQYYKKGIIMKTGDSKRLIYKFGARYVPK